MDVGEVLDVVQSVAITLAAVAAVLGIDAWRREFVGKRRIELAEDILTRFYEARDVVHTIRSPFSYAGEGSSRTTDQYETEEVKQILDNTYVVVERYEKHKDLFNQLQSLRYRAAAQFGSEALQPFQDLSRIVDEIFVAARMLQFYWREQGRRTWPSDEAFQRHLNEMERHEAVFWEEPNNHNDPINPRLDSCIAQMEEICRRQVEEQLLGTIWKWPRTKNIKRIIIGSVLAILLVAVGVSFLLMTGNDGRANDDELLHFGGYDLRIADARMLVRHAMTQTPVEWKAICDSIRGLTPAEALIDWQELFPPVLVPDQQASLPPGAIPIPDQEASSRSRLVLMDVILDECG